MFALQKLRDPLCAAVILAGFSTPAFASSIIFDGVLSTDGTPHFGSVSADGEHTDPDSTRSDYWSFKVKPDTEYIVTVSRLEDELDPALWIFNGLVSDPSAYQGGSDPFFDNYDPDFIDFADDEIIYRGGPFGDPRSVFSTTYLPPTASGSVTAIVTNYFSWEEQGGDGAFDYTISVSEIASMPVPASLPLLFFGAASFWAIRRRRAQRP